VAPWLHIVRQILRLTLDCPHAAGQALRADVVLGWLYVKAGHAAAVEVDECTHQGG
jgi:hypothetical protein